MSGRSTGHGSDVLVDAEGFVGSAFDDVLGGSKSEDRIFGGQSDRFGGRS